MRVSYLILLLLVIFYNLSAYSQNWQGQWSSSFGKINFIEKSINPQDAYLVFGNYGDTGTLIGVSVKESLYGVFYDSKTQKAGNFKFIKDKTSVFFNGKWKYQDKQQELSWNGSLIDHKIPKSMRGLDRFRSFEGKWMSNFGPLDLRQDSVFVEGQYSNKGKIYGVYNQSNTEFYGLFTNKERYGLLNFTLNKEKNGFDGVWSWKTQNWAEQKWTGSRE